MVLDDIVIDVVKIGMLVDVLVIWIVFVWFDDVCLLIVVFDFVMVVILGDWFLDLVVEWELCDLLGWVMFIILNFVEFVVLLG